MEHSTFRPVISVVTPTFHREDLLRRCAESILSQQVDADIEYTVVNDAGEPLSHAPWMDDPRVRVLTTYRTDKCVARNTGAAVSRGDWFFFLDDDDYVLPGAFAALVEVIRKNPQAVFVYGGYTGVDEGTKQTNTIQPEIRGVVAHMVVAGEFTPLQATWIRRDAFWATGGFDPQFIATEDVDMIRRVGLIGEIAGTTFVVAMIRQNHPATTKSQHNKSAQYWTLGTEKCLQMPGTFGQMVRTTHGSAYWRGRCAREYLGSAVRHASGRRFGLAWSRFSAGAWLGLRHVAQAGFWRGMRRAPG